MREFETGATRDDEDGKIDYEGFLSHDALERYGQYMLKHQIQADNKKRASDNWQKGIPKDAYIKSMFRHFMALWKLHRSTALTPHGEDELEEALCALFFNVQGYLHETLKEKHARRGISTSQDDAFSRVCDEWQHRIRFGGGSGLPD